MKKLLILTILILATGFLFSETFSIEGIRNETFRPGDFKYISRYHDNDKYVSDDYTFEADGFEQHVLISTPKLEKPNNGYPVIVLVHGFIQPSNYSTYNSYKYMFNRFASSEFMVAKPDLRGHGRSERNPDFNDNLYLLYYQRDVIQLITSLKEMDGVDPNNIFLMGHSNGGNQTIRTLITKPDLVKAASLWGPTIVQQQESNFYWNGRGMWKYGPKAIYMKETQPEIEHQIDLLNQGLKAYGNETIDDIDFTPYLKDIKTPFVIRHPDTDESVPYQWSLDFIKEFEDSGNKTEHYMVNYPGDNHNIAKNQYTAQMADLAWFRNFLEK